MATRVVRLVCYTLYRVILPVVLLVCAAVRFNALSFLYTIFLLLNPLLSSPTPATIRGGTGVYLRIVFVVGLLGVLAHAVFHITLAAIATDTEPYGSMFSKCSFKEKLARQIAVERLDGVPAVDVVRLVLPDVLVFLVGLIVYITCFKLLPVETEQIELPSTVKKQIRPRFSDFFTFIGEFILLVFLAASGIIVPGVLSAVYFVTFIFLATLWAFYGHLGVKFSVFRFILLIYSAAHILVLHLYQFQFFQDAVSPDDFIPRLLGLTAVVYTDCSAPHAIYFKDVSEWPWFVNPVFLLLLYFTLAFEVRRHCHRKVQETDEDKGEVDMTDGADHHKRRRRQKAGERQVASNLDESQKEHLVDAEVRDYSSIEQPAGERSGSTTMLASDTEKEDDDQMDRPEKGPPMKRRPLVSVFVYVMRQSYVLSLIAMMAWSITFHSWLTFVLLLGACFIWMMPNSRRVCNILSPVILLYGIALLVIQFVYGLNLTDSELPKERNGVKLADIGLKKFTYPCLQLALQILYTAMFWLTVRQFMRERRHSILAEGEKYPLEPVSTSPSAPPVSPQSLSEMLHFPFGVDTPDGYDSNTMTVLGQYVWYILCKYWIFVCSGMLLVISLQEVVVYRIIYMILFLLFILTFQYIYVLWRLTLFLFWWVVIVYSMIVLVMLYTYQFDNVAELWQNTTKLSIETLSDIGLEKFDTAGLFIRLLTPTSFLIFIIIQVHYFHKPFLLLSDLDRFKSEDNNAPRSPAMLPSSASTTDAEGAEDGMEKKKKSFRKRLGENFRSLWISASSTWETVTRFLWRLAEIHISKLVAFTIIMVSVNEVSAITAVYVILLVVFLPMTGCPSVLSHLVQFWTALVLLAKMIYQLGLVDNSRWLSNCTNNASVEAPFDTTIDNAIWAGLHKTDNIGHYLRNYIGILLVVLFERIVVYHQRQYFNTPDIVKPKTGIIFPDINRQKADEGLISCLKYFFNYFFYKFGLELCYIMSAIAICVRVDVLSLIYALLLGLILLLSRRGNTVFWPIYTIILVVLLPVQFLLALGLPVGLCYRYAWDKQAFFNRQLEKWLYLPDYLHPPNATKLVADFFQLLFVCLQWRVFRVERVSGSNIPDGGSNEDILPEVEAKMRIPVEDFTTKIKSYLDIIKNFVFTYMYWVTLAIVFIAGTTRINLFSMGYVIAVFCFMWFGQEFLIKPLRKLLRAWNFLIGYCFFVLLFKAALQLPGCVYIEKMVDNACWLVQLLGLTCLKPAYNYPDTSDTCTVAADNTGLAWDVVCFTFLLLQRRIYASHYFRHVVSDFEAQNRLASRGCQLINKILRREVEKQKQEEKTILQNIKKKMDFLRSKQARFKGNYVEPEEHFQAIRSGDYYLFEDSEEEEEEGEEPIDTIKFGMDDDKEGEKGPSPLQLINTAVTQGTDDAVKQAAEAEEAAGASKPSSPKPTTSDEPDSPTDEGKEKTKEEEEEKGGIVAKIVNIFKFILALLASVIDWFIRLFNNISRNYRLVAAKLKNDHIRVKQQIQSEQMDMKEKEVELEERTKADPEKPEDQAQDGAPSETTDLVEVTVEPVMASDGAPLKTDPSLSGTEDDDKLDEEAEFEENQPRIYRLLVATYFALISRTELLCYFLMILNHIMNASLLSLPLPMFVFLWGMLSVPRPTKTFWITVITYTEAVVVVKYLFQFGFFPWNSKAVGKIDDPFFPPKVIGIEQKDNFAALDLVLLLALFIHRIFLKRYGLWKDEEEIQDPKEETSPPSIEEADYDTLKAEERRTSSLMVETSMKDDSGSVEESLSSETKKTKKSKLKIVFMPFYNFYKQLTSPDYNATTDVYAPMFACDFINFLIVLFGYQSFGPAQTVGGDVTSYISDNRIPVPFLIMLLAQFVLIIIDRALYLRKNVLGKFIYQIILVILIHVLLFFVLPFVTLKSFTENRAAQLWYFIKCIYFALSAYQIKSAYPTRILGNFLTKKYNYVNLILFKGFLAIPFLLELRTLMDWMWTNTTMAVGSWLQMEDIYANIYVLKCFRVIEKTHPTPRAVPKKAIIKYGVGGLLLFVVIFIIWFPLVIFSFANTVYVANPPTECSISVALAGYQPLFTISGQQQNIRLFTDGQFSSLGQDFDKNVAATSFLSNYDYGDVTKIQLDGKSTSVWGISPPSLVQLKNDLNDTSVTIRMEFLVTFKRQPHSEAGELLTQLFTKELTDEEKNATFVMLSTGSSKPVTIENVFPEFIRLGMKTADPVFALLGTDKSSYTNINIQLMTLNDTSWWEILDLNDPSRMLTLITFNDRVAPSGLSVITGYGVIGLYVSFILLIGRVLRISTTGQSVTISFRELPHVDNILRLCLDIYLVREMQEFRLEEDLYAKLIFVYRSAETRVKWTRLPMSQILEAKKNL